MLTEYTSSRSLSLTLLSHSFLNHSLDITYQSLVLHSAFKDRLFVTGVLDQLNDFISPLSFIWLYPHAPRHFDFESP